MVSFNNYSCNIMIENIKENKNNEKITEFMRDNLVFIKQFLQNKREKREGPYLVAT